MGVVDDAVAALEAGELVVLPTDTVYGLAGSPDQAGRISELKMRRATTPIALVAATVDELLARLPELPARDAAIARALLPGPYTLVLRNPARRFPELTGATPEAIGVRVPALSGVGAEILARIGAVAATSANLHGGPDPRTLADVPDQFRTAAAVLVDGGVLPGTASTVIDFTGPEPRVIREGAAPAGEAIARVAAALP